MKGKEEVIAEFNEYVNMTAEELESWLKSGDSNSAGWPKDDAEGDGETVGHDSGRRIVEILKENPEKKEDAYTDEQVEHMRKVVAYCKRHLAQESKSNSEKSEDEVKKTKSYASLKNWGHDFLKAQGKESDSKGGEEKKESNGSGKQKNGSSKKKEEEEKADEGDDQSEEKAGDKRKKADEESGSNKKRQTRQGESKKSDEKGDDAEEEEAKEDGDEEMEDDGEEADDDKENGGGKTKKGPKKGDTVSWKWGNGNPEGKVLDVKEEKTTIETKNGNEVSRDGKPDDPAVVLDTGKSKAIKSNHELD